MCNESHSLSIKKRFIDCASLEGKSEKLLKLYQFNIRRLNKTLEAYEKFFV